MTSPTNTEIIKVWTASSSAAEAAKTLGMDVALLWARISKLRAMGVENLKTMPKGRPKLVIDELQRVCDEANEKHSVPLSERGTPRTAKAKFTPEEVAEIWKGLIENLHANDEKPKPNKEPNQ